MSDCKMITYDLLSPGKDYKDLIIEIKKLGIWGKVCESMWIVKTPSLTSVQIRDRLLNCMDNNDRLFVADLVGVAAWKNTICESSWLKDNL